MLYNLLIMNPPKSENSISNIRNFWNQKIELMKFLFREKNTIYNTIIKIKNHITNNLFNNRNTTIEILSNIVSEKDKDTISEYKFKTIQNLENNKYMNSLNYKVQLTKEYFKYEEELEDINIIYKNQNIQFIAIDLLIKKICEDNSFNIEIYVNQEEKKQTYNFINAFIFQCFGFIPYELLIKKLLEAHKYYSKHNKLKPKINNRIVQLIFKITKYLWDHENYNCSYFQSSDDLKNSLKKFLTKNNTTDQIKPMLDYKKDNQNKIDIIDKDKKDYDFSDSSFTNSPHGGFEFDILKYKEKDIALIISYVSIKNFKNLYNHLYELNPTIKKKEDKPNLTKIIDFSNNLTNFFIEEVFSYDLLKVRKNVVEKIIQIILELKNIGNFNDLISIYSALISIKFRLPKTWDLIDSKIKSKLTEMNKLCDFQECYKNIREEQYKCYKEKKFFIPLLNITTKHINFYDEGCKYVGKSGLICVEKIIVNQNEIEDFKNQIRPLRRKYKIFKSIKNNNELNELKIVFYNINPKNLEDLEKISQKLEPDFTLTKSPDNRKRRTKTDNFINSNKFINK